jgi:hypothetical protein|tara:strand:- start:634 stop:1170 length:537 start_codon:yes stop_codon:yes gene_type:complete
MKKQFLPPLIEITEPDSPAHGIKLIARINDSLNYPNRSYSFYKQDDFLSIVHHWIITPKNKAAYLATEQFDAPLEILPWFIDKLEFFMKSSTQGGLPANKIATDKEKVRGEYIILGRAMDAGNARREGGYILDNIDRKDHHKISTNPQDITFSDSFLFEGGLMDLWKDLAEKYKGDNL